jgi:hypothetical protein
VTNAVRQRKPGPEPERLKIEKDPEEALRKLLTPKPTEQDDAGDDGEEPDDDSPRD